MNALHDELMIASCLEDVEKGDKFKRWPLHITLVPWFTVPRDQHFELDEALRHIAEHTEALKVRGGEVAHFGPQRLQVRLLGDLALHDLHGKLTQAVERAHGHIESSAHIGEHYRPHITIHNERVDEGQEITLHSFQVVGKIPDTSAREVKAVYRFEG